MMRARCTASWKYCGDESDNPGAIILMTDGMNIIITAIKDRSDTVSIERSDAANSMASLRPFFVNNDVKVGVNTLLRPPSANSERKIFANLNAMMKISLSMLVPIVAAIIISRT